MKINRHILDNGLRLVHSQDESTQMVALNILYNDDNLRPGIEKCMCRKEDILNLLSQKKIEVLITLGAGDIDNYVPAIAKQLAE